MHRSNQPPALGRWVATSAFDRCCAVDKMLLFVPCGALTPRPLRCWNYGVLQTGEHDETLMELSWVLHDFINNPVCGFRFNPIERLILVQKPSNNILPPRRPESMHAPALA